jgi:DNA-directed RNA polymerase specialized sigma24 family protein
VEDLVQECLLAMHNQRHTYQSDQPLTAWVHAIARYKMIDLLRAKSVREDLHDPLDDATSNSCSPPRPRPAPATRSAISKRLLSVAA